MSRKRDSKRKIAKRENGTQSKHKDTLFRLVFGEKKDLLELYNAIRGTDYHNPDDLEVTTLDNMLFMGVKNDLSFLIDHVMNLYEHQSSWNPNMPLRGLEYFAKLYKKYVKSLKADVYGSRRIPLPYPQYIVFYNGAEEQPERQYLRLSDSYIHTAGDMSAGEEICLECVAIMLNINFGKNQELMAKCGKLSEYAEFIDCVRRNADGDTVTEEVMERAIEECMQKNILADVLQKHRWEVSEMFQKFDLDKYIKNERQYAYEDGIQVGEQRGELRGELRGVQKGMERINKLMNYLLADGRMEDLQRCVSDVEYQKTLLTEYKLGA